MVNLTINGTPVSVPEGTTILEAARIAHIHIPHLCYLKDLNEIGACRLCAVEVEGEAKLTPACDNVVREGMVVRTNSSRVRWARKINLELILSQHDCTCATCVRSSNCKLQKLANDFGILETRFRKNLIPKKFRAWDHNFPLIRESTKCIGCMRCIQVCDKMQGMHIWDLEGTGGRTHINVADMKDIQDSNCTLCGQCITHCPTGALRERNDIDRVMWAIDNPDITTVVQIAPAVRTAWGESFGLKPEEATINRLAGCLRQLGIDYVFDTSFSADLTIMEEGTEFLHRLEKGDLEKYPMFTSCCPGWIRFIKSEYPDLVGQLSTAKSPQQMFGSVIKTYFAQKLGKKPEQIYSISIMPCVAKKAECDLPTMKNENGVQDVDVVLTTREVVRMFRSERLSVAKVYETPFDRLMGDYSGAGVIFGATGGVMEAALRSAYYLVTGKNPPAEAFNAVRASAFSASAPWRSATYDIGGQKITAAVVSGLANTRKLCEAILAGQVKYDFVEVMACPGGCSGGGGQPINVDDEERALSRGQVLYNIDRGMTLRFSHENEEVLALYSDMLEAPYSEKAEKLLHTDHFKC
ncbi:MAG: [FeFe] hydrogenase, group A [Eubacteriales bacterium]|nr:[FeFe] hydrogenase, group A [Eubacteriales bacterium]